MRGNVVLRPVKSMQSARPFTTRLYTVYWKYIKALKPFYIIKYTRRYCECRENIHLKKINSGEWDEFSCRTVTLIGNSLGS